MKKKFIIGIDLGGTNLKIALLDLKYNIINKSLLSTKRFVNKESLISVIANSINTILQNNNLGKRNILGLGLGLPGPIDQKRGVVHFFPNIPGWKEVNLKRILEHKLRLPVFLDNDANLMCWAEYKLGCARGLKNAVCITLGTGVGGGIIIDGKLIRGRDNATGEIGHIPINEYGPKCNCGGRACLEEYIGNSAIAREAKRVFKRKISLEELEQLAKNKNRQALAIWSTVGKRLGIALAGVVNILNPDVVVIGGGIANVGKILFEKVNKTIHSQAMPVQAKGLRVFKAGLGNDAGLIGAAILVKDNIRFKKQVLGAGN